MEDKLEKYKQFVCELAREFMENNDNISALESDLKGLKYRQKTILQHVQKARFGVALHSTHSFRLENLCVKVSPERLHISEYVEMDSDKAEEILQSYNLWRTGGGGEMPDTKEITMAIDLLLMERQNYKNK